MLRSRNALLRRAVLPYSRPPNAWQQGAQHEDADCRVGRRPDSGLRGAWPRRRRRGGGGELLQTSLQSLPRPLPGNGSEVLLALPVAISVLHLSRAVYGGPAVSCSGDCAARRRLVTKRRRIPLLPWRLA